MDNKESNRRHFVHHLDKRLRFRLRIYFFVALFMLAFVIFDVATAKINILFALVSIIIGIIVGVLSSRMFRISWSHNANKVVSQLDLFGVVILVLYILFEIKRNAIVGFFVQGPQVGAVSFAIISGIMIGRVLGTRGKIIQVLKEQKVFF